MAATATVTRHQSCAIKPTFRNTGRSYNVATSARRLPEKSNAIDRMGRTVVYEGELMRHRVYTRFLHWMVGIFFFLALLTGFGIYLPWIFRFFTPLFGGG